jgi:hypothetical protein
VDVAEDRESGAESKARFNVDLTRQHGFDEIACASDVFGFRLSLHACGFIHAGYLSSCTPAVIASWPDLWICRRC